MPYLPNVAFLIVLLLSSKKRNLFLILFCVIYIKLYFAEVKYHLLFKCTYLLHVFFKLSRNFNFTMHMQITEWKLSVNSMNSVQQPKKILSFLVNHFYNGANRHAIVTYFVGTTKQINHQVQDWTH